MDAAKIRLSPEELSLVRDPGIILTKNAVMKKMHGMMEILQEMHKPLVHGHPGLPGEVIKTGAKISKGENYQGLPYLVLDQPRYFEIGHIFAIRTMFWWGKYFSLTLHLSGRYLQAFSGLLVKEKKSFERAGYLYCRQDDQWKHHLEEDNYAPLQALDETGFERQLGGRPFAKLSKMIPIGEIKTSLHSLHGEYQKLLNLLKP